MGLVFLQISERGHLPSHSGDMPYFNVLKLCSSSEPMPTSPLWSILGSSATPVCISFKSRDRNLHCAYSHASSKTAMSERAWNRSRNPDHEGVVQKQTSIQAPHGHLSCRVCWNFQTACRNSFIRSGIFGKSDRLILLLFSIDSPAISSSRTVGVVWIGLLREWWAH